MANGTTKRRTLPALKSTGKSREKAKGAGAGEEKLVGNGDETESGKSKSIGTESAGGKAGAETKRETATADNAPVNPTSLTPDDNYERDENGNIVYKADGTPRKKRGRKPGQTASVVSTTNKVPKRGDKTGMAVEMLAAQFQILNTGIAFLTKFDDFKLEDSEAMQMANATANVMEQFDYTPDPKVAAVLGLVTTTSMIYGPRLYLYRSHTKKIAEQKKEKKIEAADEAVSQTTSQGMSLGMSG